MNVIIIIHCCCDDEVKSAYRSHSSRGCQFFLPALHSKISCIDTSWHNFLFVFSFFLCGITMQQLRACCYMQSGCYLMHLGLIHQCNLCSCLIQCNRGILYCHTLSVYASDLHLLCWCFFRFGTRPCHSAAWSTPRQRHGHQVHSWSSS